jgi:hypothetical protein
MFSSFCIYQLQFRLTEHNPAVEYNIIFCNFTHQQFPADGTQNASTAESPTVGRNNIAALQTSTVQIRTLRHPETLRTSTEYG